MRIGIDLGGSHIAIGLIDNGKVIHKSEYNFSKDDKEILDKVLQNIIDNEINNILDIVDINKIDMIGISVPGRPQNGSIEHAANIKVKNLNIQNMIKQKINKPVYTMNDGMCAGIAEKEYGNLKGCNNGVFLGLGTGVGTAVFIHGKLVQDIRSAGHMIIEKNGRKCNCGKNGCYETYASMNAMKTQIKQRLNKKDLSSEEILEQLKNPKVMEKVEDIIKDYIEYVAIGVANFARICSADTLVIGGSFVYYKDILFDRLLNELDRIMIPMEKDMVKVRLAKLGNDAGMIGATKIEN